MYIFHVCVTITIARQDCHSNSVVHVLYNTLILYKVRVHQRDIVPLSLHLSPEYEYFDNQIVGVPFLDHLFVARDTRNK